MAIDFRSFPISCAGMPDQKNIPRGAESYFDAEIAAKDLYKAVAEGHGELKSFAGLGRNFVKANERLLKMPNEKTQLKQHSGAEFDPATATYRSTAAGYVAYGVNELEVLPFLWINEDATECHAIVPPKNSTKAVVDRTFIAEQILARGIKAQSREEGMAEAVALYEKNTGGRILLASGQKAVDGRNAVVTLTYEIGNVVGKEDVSGKIDYRERNFIQNVLKGQVVASFSPGAESSPGKDIFDRPIKPRIVKLPTHRMGKNLALNEQTNEISAVIDGIIEVTDDNTINVSNVQVIKGDVDLNVGNLDVKGDIQISGSILSGFKVSATGNIECGGNIEEAFVTCGGNLNARGGIIGGASVAKIYVTGDCQVAFIRGGVINVKGDLTVSQLIMHSEVVCSGRVVMMKDKGLIIGGSVCAALGMDLITAGNKTGVKTKLIAGVNPDIEKRLRGLSDLTKGNEENMRKLKGALGSQYFEDPKAFLQKVPPAKFPAIKEIVLNLKKVMTQQAEIEKECNELTAISCSQMGAAISIHDICNEGVILQIGKIRREITREVRAAQFVYSKEDDAIVEKAARKSGGA